MKRKVMVFGVFDGLHEGHRAFLQQAKTQGNYLIAVLAKDNAVERLKGRTPAVNLAERFARLRAVDHVDAVIVSGDLPGEWKVVDLHRPEVIAVGYDQSLLKNDLERYFSDKEWRPEIRLMRDFEGETYHSSLLRQNSIGGSGVLTKS